MTPHDDRRNPIPDDQRIRRRALIALRATVLLLMVVITSLGIVKLSSESSLGLDVVANWWAAVVGTLAFFALVVAIDILTPKRKLATISSILLGVFAGILATALLSFVVDLFKETFVFTDEYNRIFLTIKILLGIGLCYLGVTTVLQTSEDFRLVIPYVEFAKQFRGTKPLVLDSSALIDARVLEAAETGFLQAPLIVHRCVLDELQTMADAGDKSKRARGRRGLDIVARFQRSPRLDVSIDDAQIPGTGVDQKLVELARLLPALIVTGDTGLARVAAIQGVGVLNINDLSRAMRPTLVPGDSITIELVRPGEQPNQAVGFLDDGTMVVAENGAPHIDTTQQLTVTSAVQTSNGRLIFARMPSDAEPPDERSRAPETDELPHERPDHDSSDADPTEDGPAHAPRALRKPSPRGRNPRR
ncbi:MAG: hypothetical protein KDA16_02730 [Phycisphaerales bacterium]|nr:hypothetical protein [Phycisphaerales bacterium]